MKKFKYIYKTIKINAYTWECKECGYINYGTSDYCVKCG